MNLHDFHLNGRSLNSCRFFLALRLSALRIRNYSECSAFCFRVCPFFASIQSPTKAKSKRGFLMLDTGIKQCFTNLLWTNRATIGDSFTKNVQYYGHEKYREKCTIEIVIHDEFFRNEINFTFEVWTTKKSN